MMDSAHILKQRASRLAHRIVNVQEKEGSFSLLEFNLGPESYAIDAYHVREIVATTHLTPLPSVPPFIVGILAVRGLIWSVMDLRLYFGIPRRGISDHPRAILVETEDLRFGILADSTLRILHPDSLHPPPEVTERIPRNVVRGIINELTVVLDLELLAKDPRMVIKDELE